MIVKFIGTPGFESYQSKVGKFKDGDEVDLPERTAKELVESFPKNFCYMATWSELREEKATIPSHNKIIKPKKNK